MTFKAFVRQLGLQPGVQLNPLQDNTDGVDAGNADQSAAIVARLSRGRIDRPIRVNRGTFLSKTGTPEPMRINALNEARLQISEALNSGAQEVIVMRITPSATASKKYASISLGVPAGGPTEEPPLIPVG